jgi:hypothetical protein
LGVVSIKSALKRPGNGHFGRIYLFYADFFGFFEQGGELQKPRSPVPSILIISKENTIIQYMRGKNINPAKRMFLLIAFMSVLTVAVNAQQYDPESDFSVSRNEDGKSVKITGYKGSKQSVRIPPKINGASVTGIGDSAFSNRSGLVSIYIPKSVTSIGNEAFFRCEGLTRIITRNSITSVGNYAFYGCTSLPGVTIPNSVTSIGNYAFSGCTGLASVTIGRGVTRIGESAFSFCENLAGVTIGRSVARIGDLAFYNCNGLVSVTFQSAIASANFNSSAFPGDLHARFYGAGAANGTPGTYTRDPGKEAWTNQ